MRVGDGVTLEAGNSIRNDVPVLIIAETAPEKGHKGNARDHQDAPDRTAGIKRKADEIQGAPDADEGPNTSKRQFLGICFLSTALKTLNPLKNISKFMGWGRAEEETPVEASQPSLHEEPTPAIAGDIEVATEEPLTDELPVADTLVDDKVKTAPTRATNKKETREEVPPPTVAVAPAALPVAIDDTTAVAATTAAPTAEEEEQANDLAQIDIQHDLEPVATTTPAIPSKPEPSFFRPSAHYSPPVAKAIKVVKRSELKRQLKEQRAPVTKPNPATNTQPNSTSNTNAIAPARKNITNTSSGKNKSRGSRLLTMAHDKTPLAVVSMALAPPAKTPRAAFGLDDVIITPPAKVTQQQQQQQELESGSDEGERQEQLAGADEQMVQPEVAPVATIPVALEPSPKAKTAVEEGEEPISVEEGEEQAKEDSSPGKPDATAAAAAEEETAAAATQPNPSSGVSGSPLSLALWGEAPAQDPKERENEIEESHGTVSVNALVSVALAAMAGVAVAAPGDNTPEQVDNENSNDAAGDHGNDEAVAMEIDEAPIAALVDGEAAAVEEVEVTPSPLPEAEVAIVVEERETEEERPTAPVADVEIATADAEEEEHEDKNKEDEQDQQDKDAALVDAANITGNQFTPLPRLLPRWGISSGGDSAATSPSSCSLLPLGLSGGRNPSYKISKPGATAPAAANSPSIALRSHKKNSGKADNDDDDDINDGAASTHGPHTGEEGTGRRVRFIGVEEIEEEEKEETEKDNDQEQQQDGDGEREIVCRPSIRPLPPPICRPSSANGRTHLTGAQPRFGIGAFVRISASTTITNSITTTTVQQSNEGTSPPDAGTATAGNTNVESSISPVAAAGTDGGNKTNIVVARKADTSPPVQFNASTDQDTVTPLVITRRLQHSGTLLRRAAALLPAPLFSGESIPQILREAFLNARLAEHWCRGEAWSRLDLSGIELVRDGDREAHLNAVIATLVGQRGDTAVQTALDQLQIEWEHLKCFRQKYVSPSEPGTIATAAAPKSILKHASGVSPPSAAAAGGGGGGGAADHTPPLDRNSNLPGFEDILAAEVVPGSTSPHEWAIGALAGGGHTGHLTPGLIVRSRGIKMLASLHNQAAAAGGGGNGNGTPPDGSNAPGTGQTTDVVGGVGAVATRASTAAAAAAAEEQQGQNPNLNVQQQQLAALAEDRRRRSSNGARRGASSRGHRLLQALQNAAGPHTNNNSSGGYGGANTNGGPPTTAAAAAARLIVDSSNPGGDGGDFMTGPMATSFVIT